MLCSEDRVFSISKVSDPVLPWTVGKSYWKILLGTCEEGKGSEKRSVSCPINEQGCHSHQLFQPSRVLRKTARSSSLRAAATPYSGSGCETQELRMWKHRILAPDSGDVYEGMISVSSDSRIFPYIEKCLLFCCLGPKWYLTLCDPMNCSPPGFSVHGIFQAITLEQFAISFSRGSSWPQDLTPFSCTTCIGRKILYH